MRVSDVMTVDVATTTADAPLREVARTLVDRGISGMPVVDAGGGVIGVVSEADVLAKERREPDAKHGVLARLIHHDADDGATKREARTAGDAMTAPAFTTVPYMSVASAAEVMLEHGINRLPVVNGGGHLVGIVTRADLVRAFARTDEQIAADIREEIATQQAWAGDANTIEVTVANGDALLTGTVSRRTDADIVPHLVRLVPGVVAVRSELTWAEND